MHGRQFRYNPEYTFGGQIQITLAINAEYKIVSTTTLYNDLKTVK